MKRAYQSEPIKEFMVEMKGVRLSYLCSSQIFYYKIEEEGLEIEKVKQGRTEKESKLL